MTSEKKKFNFKALQVGINDERDGVSARLGANMVEMPDRFVRFAEKSQKRGGFDGKHTQVDEALVCVYLVEAFERIFDRSTEALNYVTNLIANTISLCDDREQRVKMATAFITHMSEHFESWNADSINTFAHQTNIIDKDKHKFVLEWEDDDNTSGTMSIIDRKSGEIIMHGIFGKLSEGEGNDALAKAIAEGFSGNRGDA